MGRVGVSEPVRADRLVYTCIDRGGCHNAVNLRSGECLSGTTGEDSIFERSIGSHLQNFCPNFSTHQNNSGFVPFAVNRYLALAVVAALTVLPGQGYQFTHSASGRIKKFQDEPIAVAAFEVMDQLHHLRFSQDAL